MKHLLTLICFLALFTAKLLAQSLDPAILETCNTGKNASCLTEDEKKVLLYLNLARTHPKEFLTYYIPEAARTLKEETVPEYKSLVKDLKSMKPLALLQPDAGLSDVAKEHATDMGTSGKTGHSSSKGKSYEQRMKKYKDVAIAENCDYGFSDPVLIVTHLLIDSKTASLGHRKNILNPVYKLVGTSIQPHKKYTSNCVMDFSE